MRFLKRCLLLVLLMFTTQIGLHAQHPRLPACITGADGNCRGLAKRQVSSTNATNVLRLTVPNAGRTMAILSACSAGTAAVTISASADNFQNLITIDTIAAAATVTKQYDV